MKRLHLHVSVPDLAQSISFYETLFGAPPSAVKDDYAKWMLEDPRVNFAISQRARAVGLDHVGIQVDTSAELHELAGRLKGAGAVTLDQEATTCCYAQSDKSWVSDPAGLRWETFYTFGAATQYGEDEELAASAAGGSACCAPEPARREPEASACCGPSESAATKGSPCCGPAS
jgi:catechol 2,3-dioxygenase-like lactoylglutathione lyase family enzyme